MLFWLHSLVDTVRVNHVYQHFIIKSRYETKIIADRLALLWKDRAKAWPDRGWWRRTPLRDLIYAY